MRNDALRAIWWFCLWFLVAAVGGRILIWVVAHGNNSFWYR
jgi:hypothetical protein